MHRYGTLDIAAGADSAPVLAGLRSEPWTLKNVRVLEIRTEIDDTPADRLLPPSLRPPMPAFASITVSHVADSPVGPFHLALLRIGARIGGRGALFQVGGVCDNAAARDLLAERWGYRLTAGEVALDELYYQVTGRVEIAGRALVDLRLTERLALPGTRLSVLPTVALARHDAALLLVGAPAEVAVHKNDRGTPQIVTLEPSAFGADGLVRATSPMGCTYGTVDLTLLPIEFTIDPIRAAEDSLALVKETA